MANVSGQATIYNAPNLVGEFLQLGQVQTPFLNMIGGLNGGRVVKTTKFAMSQTSAMEAASQPAITETGSATAPTATTFVREQAYNVVQIFQRAVNISYSKMGNADELSGINVNGEAQPVQDEKAFQIAQNLKQVALDANYTFLKGAFADETNAATAVKTRGIMTAITTNAVDASSAALSKALLQSLFKKAYDSGVDFTNIVLFTNSTQKQKISDIYGYAPQDRNIGGVAIKQIETDYGNVMVVLEPNLAQTELLLASMNYIKPTFKNIPSKGTLFYEELAKVGAAEQGMIYGELGIDYGHETRHAKMTGLAV